MTSFIKNVSFTQEEIEINMVSWKSAIPMEMYMECVRNSPPNTYWIKTYILRWYPAHLYEH